ncbi:MAG TPA: hypothetical protein VKG44_08480 [Candidatus Baltobacteraceae bacterium]|nr:hypothetical protein [Candidatus Baltobacteraceae bacterium]
MWSTFVLCSVGAVLMILFGFVSVLIAPEPYRTVGYAMIISGVVLNLFIALESKRARR